MGHVYLRANTPTPTPTLTPKLTLTLTLAMQAFAKEQADARKTWIEGVHGETHVDYDVDLMKYSNFFNKEFVLFSQASVVRAIPVRAK